MSQNTPENKTASFNTRLLYPIIALVAVILPVILWQARLPFISNSYGPLHEPFELFVMCASFALAAIAYLEIRRRGTSTFVQLLPILLIMTVAFHYLIVMNEFEGKSFDYTSYENAAKAIANGDNPYTGAYLYPPFTARIITSVERVIENLVPIPEETRTEMAWFLVFYLYQCVQFGLIITAFVLCLKFVRKAGMAEPAASILVTAVFLINNPLIRTLKHHQVNLWLLDLMLLAVLLVDTRPWISGLAIAVSSHIKLYPALLILPLVIMKKFKAVVWTIAGIAAIVLLQTGFGSDFNLYEQFTRFASRFPVSIAFRDNGIYGIAYNTFKLLGVDVTTNSTPADISAWILTVALVAWFAIRMLRREKSYSDAVKSGLSDQNARQISLQRIYGYFADTLALMLLLSPIVWEHHYVLAVPVVLWAVITQGWKKPWMVGIGAFLILAVPTFDVFPVSYHRLAGLLILTYLTPPEIILPNPSQTASDISVPASTK